MNKQTETEGREAGRRNEKVPLSKLVLASLAQACYTETQRLQLFSALLVIVSGESHASIL
jgi:hypothetical protein